MFGHTKVPLAPRHLYFRRLIGNSIVAGVLIVGSLAIGVVGYHRLVGLGWIDALLNASMILGGMGPVDPVHTTGGKLFASFYALYSGVMLLTSVSVVSAPILHRFLHRFHLEDEDTMKDRK